VAAVVPIHPGVDLESLGLSHNPRFIAIINRSWENYKKTGGVSLEERRFVTIGVSAKGRVPVVARGPSRGGSHHQREASNPARAQVP
jgi:hypothetical protein